MYLSYSGHKAYKDCPRMYWHRYIGKTKLPAPDNKVNSLYGSTVGTIFEYFYNDGLWRKPGIQAILEDLIEPTLTRIIDQECRSGTVDWSDPKANYKSREALVREVRKTMPRAIEIIRHHRLLGKRAEAEVKLDSSIEGHVVGGRADFIIERIPPHGDLVIIDGKGSRHRDKYVDPHQLWWYSMLYRHQFGRVPDKVGFLFWRQEPENSLDWVDFSERSLDDLLSGVLSSIRTIEEGKAQLAKTPEPEVRAALQVLFPPQIGSKCNLCSYLPVCEDGTSYTTRRFSPSEADAFGVEEDEVGL